MIILLASIKYGLLRIHVIKVNQRLKEFITARLGNFDGHAGSLKDMFTAFNDQNVDRPVDDRTLLVITWKRDEYVASLSKTAI